MYQDTARITTQKARRLDVLPYLNASRYCQSDRLARFAAKQFG